MATVRTPPKCYVASPLGFTEAGRCYYRETYLPALASVVEPIDPWSLTAPEEIAREAAAGRQYEMAMTIGRRNIAAIRDCALLAAYLDGQEPDSGTAAEIGFAAGIGVKCFGLRTDLRQTGEPGTSVNPQVEIFIVESGGQVATTLDGLVALLAAE
jgi:nucleoside 2-deoxyribosyltransferase